MRFPVVKFTKTATGTGERRWELVCSGARVSIWEEEKVPEMDDGDACIVM